MDAPEREAEKWLVGGTKMNRMGADWAIPGTLGWPPFVINPP
jgi:hypothetical protein